MPRSERYNLPSTVLEDGCNHIRHQAAVRGISDASICDIIYQAPQSAHDRGTETAHTAIDAITQRTLGTGDNTSAEGAVLGGVVLVFERIEDAEPSGEFPFMFALYGDGLEQLARDWAHQRDLAIRDAEAQAERLERNQQGLQPRESFGE
ncbi:hypothetical protein Tdes44962_MAKER08153 [Teratosphaeria destructans]|uniref:Uncharacterized protein n=1 Tax=Teratosphaeria destructans TaxID=418781 RepID=A0A9W7SXT5_9PEZI|nr:hypothetical protein Tdes44962_MAKER08153 [Teratosphaeria destructans]